MPQALLKVKNKAVCWKYFSNSESTNNGKAKCRVSCNTALETYLKERSNCINTVSQGRIGYRLPSDRYFVGLIERKYVDVRELQLVE